ncbi:MAG: isocitrate/isopropylmalate dehydrogenase family protein [Candidatus Lokiarchaeota archaeon]|nr:isocitrate/isopropylmalate dehydrogenase family protein [Candidatus Lokiarchaeota archaeon]
MSKYKIAVLPGDGIGPEIIDEALKILKAYEEVSNKINFEFLKYECGAQYYLKSGKKEEWPEEVFEICKNEADAILLGAIGWTDPGTGETVSYPSGRMVGLDILFGLRFGLDLYANIRPTKLYPNVPHRISGEFRNIWDPKNVDFVTIRENTEGLYADTHGGLNRGGKKELATDVRLITRKGSERIIKFAFEYCKRRNKGSPKDGKLRLTCVDKSNVTAGCKLFRKIYQEIALNYPEIEQDYAFIDAFTQWIIRTPEWFDVCVVPNMFGDIATDLAAVLQGSLGMASSGNVGDNYGMFEPLHGSAPKYTGKNVVNPIATILAASMMLDWLSMMNKNDVSCKKGSELIEKAVQEVLKEGKIRTYDLGGSSSTSDVGDAISIKLKELYQV